MGEGDEQDCHEDGKPQLLRAQQGVRIASPFASLDVIQVT
jgi:hypothetical protein